MTKLLSPKEASLSIGLGLHRTRELMQTNGGIRSVTIGKRLYTREEWIEEFLTRLVENKDPLVALELRYGGNDYPIGVRKARAPRSKSTKPKQRYGPRDLRKPLQ